jgi:beta-glucosidase
MQLLRFIKNATGIYPRKALGVWSLALGLMCFCSTISGQVYKESKAPVEDRVNDLLSKMTLEEKIDYLGGVDNFYIRDIPRLGVPRIKMSDGPIGARNDGRTTAYPAGICSASTWDTSLVNKLGVGLGMDCRARGTHILLGPGINIYRAPMCGRNFEYFGEDPFLAGQIGVAYIQGLQSQRVAACAKHYAANNQEWDRYRISSEVDERTLQEIYLPAFKVAVQQAKVATVMSSYNLINGEHATQNGHLNNKILKGDWGFDGILMSDWGSTHASLEAALGGLDIEMPKGDHLNAKKLMPAIADGRLPMSVIDDKVKRILRIMFRFGFYDLPQKDESIPLNNPETVKIALDLARSGMVLLKNQDNILPFNKQNVKSVALIGVNANEFVSGGGSGWTFPFAHVTVMQGLKNMLGENVTITYVPGFPTVMDYARLSTFYVSNGSNSKGLKGEYFKNKTLAGTPDFVREDSILNFNWFNGNPNVEGFANTDFSVRWTGVFRATENKVYEFHVTGDDGYRLWVDNKLVTESWKNQGLTPSKGVIALKAGHDYDVKLEYYQNTGSAAIALGYKSEFPALEEAVKVAAQSDIAILCMGLNGDIEKEGIDRPFELPEGQDALISAIAKANKNTAVVMFAGGNVDMQKWLPDTRALLMAWYPGQDGGTAVAEVLFGDVNPSGKLPVSFEKKWADNPTYNSYYDPDGDKKNPYTEGIFVGYRYYDTKNVEPQFPFGYGLSYTTFDYGKMKIKKTGDQKFAVSIQIKNSGLKEGAEVVQLYVSQKNCTVPRPVKELKGFAKVSLKAGESKTVTIQLDNEAFQFFHPEKNRWIVEPDAFDIMVGASSRDIRAVKTIKL